MQLTPRYHNPITPLPLLRALFRDWPSAFQQRALIPRENLVFFRSFEFSELTLYHYRRLSYHGSSLTSPARVSFNLRIIYTAVSSLLLSCPGARYDKENYLFNARTRVCAVIPSFVIVIGRSNIRKIPPVSHFSFVSFDKFDRDYSSEYNSILTLILRIRRK